MIVLVCLMNLAISQKCRECVDHTIISEIDVGFNFVVFRLSINETSFDHHRLGVGNYVCI